MLLDDVKLVVFLSFFYGFADRFVDMSNISFRLLTSSNMEALDVSHSTTIVCGEEKFPF